MPLRLESNRLVLRDFINNDAHDLFDLYKLRETSEFESWNPHEDIEDSVALTRVWIKSLKEKPRMEFTLALLHEEQFVGLCGIDLGFGTETDDQRVGFLGYRLHPKYWNQGFATEASRRMIQFAFGDLRLHRIHSGCSVENAASIRILEKIGFRLEGTSRKSFPIEDRWTDYNLYGMLDCEIELVT